MPGRIIGVSKDVHGKHAYRMALQTREQHIRRDKAMSNICTAQVLLANIAASYAIYHGPEGLKAIAHRIHRLTSLFVFGLAKKGMSIINRTWFDTVTVISGAMETIRHRAEHYAVNVRESSDGRVSVSFDETTTLDDVLLLWNVFLGNDHHLSLEDMMASLVDSDVVSIPEMLRRKSAFLTHAVFNQYHSEMEMMRYLKRLERRDLSLTHSMIALGSCTMKLNAVTEMIPMTWPEIADVHPFTPHNQVQGFLAMIQELETMIKDISGFAGISMQPNSGAQGEYAGLLTILGYHRSRGDTKRHICLIPASAHGTNPASAVMCGMQVVIIACDKQGGICLEDLRAKTAEAETNLAALMMTYPSTHGIYEKGVREICAIIHQYGGQVYMDGANMNALVGVAKPADFGVDVMHFNLHKTFCIPHGGGGPGMGPIGAASHLIPFLPGHSVVKISEETHRSDGAVSAAPWGSAAILPISWSYMKMMGLEGLKKATSVAILNANYMVHCLTPHYPVLCLGTGGWCAHEFILDLRPIKAASGITEEDVAKRLIDFGFHAPTMSFPVAGTLMIEPTESESKAELDRFIEAMIAIREEIKCVERGVWPADDNPLINAPHTLHDLLTDWTHPYTKEQAVSPKPWVRENKFWPAVGRIDNVWGDRNLFCACPDVESYA